MKYLFEWHHGLIRKQTLWLDKQVSHFVLPALVHLTAGHPGARALEVFCFEVPHEQSVWPKEERIVVPASFTQGVFHLRPDGTMAFFVFLQPLL